MSAALELSPALTAGAVVTQPQRSRTTFPVGARFPRRAALDTAALPADTSRGHLASPPIFPVGARFPRRTAADVVVYLAELELRGEPVRSSRPIHPIGARFPLR